MDDMHVSTLRFGPHGRPEPCDSPCASEIGMSAGSPSEGTWAPKQLHDILDEADLFDDHAGSPPTLQERMENWGSD
jgi:hypothetical protein